MRVVLTNHAKNRLENRVANFYNSHQLETALSKQICDKSFRKYKPEREFYITYANLVFIMVKKTNQLAVVLTMWSLPDFSLKKGFLNEIRRIFKR